MTASSAIATAVSRFRTVVCNGDTLCLNQFALWLSVYQPSSASLTILSADLFVGTSLGQGEERLVYRVNLPGRTSYVDARNGGAEVFAVDSHEHAVPYTILNGQRLDRAARARVAISMQRIGRLPSMAGQHPRDSGDGK